MNQPVRGRARGLLLVAAVSVLTVLASAAVAQAANPTPLVNAGMREFGFPGGPDYVMESTLDGRVLLKPAEPGNLRQQWEKRAGTFGGSLYRNVALSGCLVAPAQPSSSGFDVLRTGPCSGIGTRNAWTRQNVVVGNGALALVNVQTKQHASINAFSQPADLLRLAPVSQIDLLGSLNEWFGT